MLIDRLRLENQAVTASRQRLDKMRIVDGIVERMADLPDGVAQRFGSDMLFAPDFLKQHLPGYQRTSCICQLQENFSCPRG